MKMEFVWVADPIEYCFLGLVVTAFLIYCVTVTVKGLVAKARRWWKANP